MIKKVFVTGSLFVLFGYIIYLGWSMLLGTKMGLTKKNPYKYDISSYREVDPQLVTHQEFSTLHLQLRKPTGIAIAGEYIFVTGDSALLKLNRMGKTVAKTAISEKPYCITAKNGRLYIGVENHVEVFDTACALIEKWQPYSATSIFTSIAVADTVVYLADAMSEIVVKTDLHGHVLGLVGGKDPEAGIEKLVIPSLYFDVSVDTEGFLWMVNPGKHTITNFTYDGGLRTQWGQTGMEIDKFSGCCNPSHIALLSTGDFVTSEKGLVRVKVHNSSGALLGVVAAPDQFDEGTEGLDVAVDQEDNIYILDPARKQVRVFGNSNKVAL